LKATAILPVKRFGDAKRRLAAGIDDERREALVAAMLADVLEAIGAARQVERTIMVSDEPRAAKAAEATGAEVVPDPGVGGNRDPETASGGSETGETRGAGDGPHAPRDDIATARSEAGGARGRSDAPLGGDSGRLGHGGGARQADGSGGHSDATIGGDSGRLGHGGGARQADGSGGHSDATIGGDSGRLGHGGGAGRRAGASGGHSDAALAGIAHAAERGAGRVVLLPGDCPLLDPRELDRLLTGVPERYVAIVPDRHGPGTNALLLSPPDAIRPAFGEGSRERHVAAAREAGVPHAVEELPSLALDLDTPADLVALIRALERTPARARRTAKALGI
jgi:2-phospho-L-lactate guanylyltransferase (CobY/MobA/RfbA family)